MMFVEVFRKIRDMFEATVTDVPLNIVILNEDGTATNLEIEKVYTFFSGGPDATAQANIVIKPANVVKLPR